MKDTWNNSQNIPITNCNFVIGIAVVLAAVPCQLFVFPLIEFVATVTRYIVQIFVTVKQVRHMQAARKTL